MGIGTIGDGSQTVPFSRCWIDYDAGDDGSGGASMETVVLTRDSSGISNLPGTPIDVYWEISTDRVNWTEARTTFSYTDQETSGLDESSLQLYHADSLSGPWTLVSSQSIDAARNEISGTVSSFSYFAIAARTSAGNWTTYR